MQNRHHIELTWLEDCVALAESLNFSRAAAGRYVTQPAFSRRIRSLEEWVGTPLFERTRRGVHLTRAGELFCKQAPDLIRSLYALRSETLDLAGQGAPEVVFSATHALSFTFFPAWLRKNEKIARFGSFQLLSDTMRACERMLNQGETQFLLCHYHPHMHLNLDMGRYFSVRVGTDWLKPYSSAMPGNQGEAAKPRWSVENKKPFPLLSYSNESGLGRIIASTASVNRRKRGMEVVFTSDLAATLQVMVRSGDGVAWLPDSLAALEVSNGTLCPAASEQSDLCIPVEIRLYRPAGKLSRAAEELWTIFVGDRV
ncbi:LysR family transcriptional regulator [Erwinia pyri]|uniref:LysR family transcriptional regulator n=1 Tax=Erwinia pyri TaxID=3062598 RepID=A0AA50HR32_9GAMM|nr:LysR family transcriptional regulator [Erwinia sp. DE2]WLS79640.1 LysR family transcriptional regulator [Erwinia sp. DE2]